MVKTSILEPAWRQILQDSKRFGVRHIQIYAFVYKVLGRIFAEDAAVSERLVTYAP